MFAKYLSGFRRFLVYIILLIPFENAGSTFSSTTNDAVNADLIKAAFSGKLSEVKDLLEQGADTKNAKRQDGITALMGASIEGNLEGVRFLPTKGVDVHTKANFYGNGGKTEAEEKPAVRRTMEGHFGPGMPVQAAVRG